MNNAQTIDRVNVTKRTIYKRKGNMLRITSACEFITLRDHGDGNCDVTYVNDTGFKTNVTVKPRDGVQRPSLYAALQAALSVIGDEFECWLDEVNIQGPSCLVPRGTLH